MHEHGENKTEHNPLHRKQLRAARGTRPSAVRDSTQILPPERSVVESRVSLHEVMEPEGLQASPPYGCSGGRSSRTMADCRALPGAGESPDVSAR